MPNCNNLLDGKEDGVPLRKLRLDGFLVEEA